MKAKHWNSSSRSAATLLKAEHNKQPGWGAQTVLAWPSSCTGPRFGPRDIKGAICPCPLGSGRTICMQPTKVTVKQNFIKVLQTVKPPRHDLRWPFHYFPMGRASVKAGHPPFLKRDTKTTDWNRVSIGKCTCLKHQTWNCVYTFSIKWFLWLNWQCNYFSQ